MSDTIMAPVAAPAALVAVNGAEYPLESAQLISRAEGGLALSTLAQRFANPYDETLEVKYTMPLPADGAVLGYTIRVGERVIRGEVQPRERASEAYRQALYEGRTAGLLEQSRPDTFEQSLGNVPAKTAVEVTIDVLHPLAFLAASGETESPQWEYRFPTVVNVRYLGAPGRVPDGAALSPDRGADGSIPARMTLQLTLADAADAAAVRSPSHALDVTPAGNGAAIAFRDGERLDRDVVVRWPAAGAEVGVHVVEGGGLAGDDGRYALVTLVPPAAPGRTYRRDLTLLMDTSGSMEGEPLELAKRVSGELLRSLGRADRFELIAFDSQVQRLTRGFMKADARGVEHGLKLLGALRASGGTEMLDGIREAMQATDADAQHQVVLVTDGQIGFEREVVAHVAERANVRLHAVGVGNAPNRSLTREASYAGRGVEVLVTNQPDADRAAARLVAAMAAPVLTGIEFHGTALTGHQPNRLTDVFRGRPLLVAVELSPSGGALEVAGTLAGEPWSWRCVVPSAGAQSELLRTPLPLGALFGRALVDQMEIGGRNADDAQIESVALRHRIVSRRTSLVAIAEEPSVDPREPGRRTRLAVELPAGVSAEGVGMRRVSALYHAMSARSALPHAFEGELASSAMHMDDRVPVFSRASERPRLRGVSELSDVECRWLDHDRLIVGFTVNGVGVPVRDEERSLLGTADSAGGPVTVRIDWEESSRFDVVEPGQRIWLVLVVPPGLSIGGHRAIELRWIHPDGPQRVIGIPLVFDLPPRPARPPGPDAPAR